MTSTLAAAILTGLLQTGWVCQITDPEQLDVELPQDMPVPGLITAVAQAAGCDRKENWRRF